jgi:hypothetical protein
MRRILFILFLSTPAQAQWTRVEALPVGEQQLPGTYQVTFGGANLSAGTYVYRLTAGSRAESRRMLLVK